MTEGALFFQEPGVPAPTVSECSDDFKPSVESVSHITAAESENLSLNVPNSQNNQESSDYSSKLYEELFSVNNFHIASCSCLYEEWLYRCIMRGKAEAVKCH